MALFFFFLSASKLLMNVMSILDASSSVLSETIEIGEDGAPFSMGERSEVQSGAEVRVEDREERSESNEGLLKDSREGSRREGLFGGRGGSGLVGGGGGGQKPGLDTYDDALEAGLSLRGHKSGRGP